MIGDGYTEVIHCENAEEGRYVYCALDEEPVYCDYVETVTA
jgi:hypothetical protein